MSWPGKALMIAWAPGQVTECPADRSPLGTRGRGSSKTPGEQPEVYFRSLSWPQARDHAAWQGNSEEQGRALSAGPQLNEIASWEGNGQPALYIHLASSGPLRPPPAGWAQTAPVSLITILAIMFQSLETVRKGLELISSAGGRLGRLQD